METPKFIKSVTATLSKHSPEILTGLGIAGMITTTVLAVKATPKAVALIRDAEDKKAKAQLKAGVPPKEVNEKLTPVEVVKTTWKCYIPAAATGITSATCLIGAHSVHAKRTAALATAYKLSETALTEYQAKVVETIGERKQKSIKEAIAKDKVDKNPVTNTEVIVTGKGETLCYDTLSGRYFKSDIDKLKKAENELNRRMLNDDYVSLNDFYDEIGLSFTKLGDDLGWSITKGFIELDFSSQLASDGTPCLVLDYRVAPRYDFNSLY